MLCVKNKKYMKKMAGYVVGIVTFIALSFSLFYYIQLRRNEQSIENYAFYVMDSDSQITLESVDNVLSQQEYYLTPHHCTHTIHSCFSPPYKVVVLPDTHVPA